MSEIKGYTPLTDEQKALMNEAKELEERVLRFTDKLAATPGVHEGFLGSGRITTFNAFMWLNRSIARPQRIRLDGDPPESEIAVRPSDWFPQTWAQKVAASQVRQPEPSPEPMEPPPGIIPPKPPE